MIPESHGHRIDAGVEKIVIRPTFAGMVFREYFDTGNDVYVDTKIQEGAVVKISNDGDSYFVEFLYGEPTVMSAQ